MQNHAPLRVAAKQCESTFRDAVELKSVRAILTEMPDLIAHDGLRAGTCVIETNSFQDQSS
jgi:hypothetical protein